ncbi:ScbA/BarX family gamma-butyrolactone biosynthesis protein [Streptomyces sp. NPDC096013]|uniref:ScbA/BarX family gamma-butyrolactone biosynthesis protein n=1 Tax=Streptomyces sp. NPDC096013 TaxID=3366069 RepID=UPI00380F1064
MSTHTFHAQRPALTTAPAPAAGTPAAPTPLPAPRTAPTTARAGAGAGGAAGGAGVSAHRDAYAHLSLTRTVPKEFVHRASVAEVLLTDWQRTGEDRFTVSAQWPRSHSFFTPLNGRHDPLIAAETVRQIGLLLAHTEYGVPFGHSFVMHDLTLAVDPAHLHVGAAPAALTIDTTCYDITRRRGRAASLRYTSTLRRDGHTLARADVSYTCIPPTVYQRLRGHHTHTTPLPLTAPTAPQTVGRTSPTDVVLTPTPHPHTWQLRTDTRHPVLFDHPVDHIPGMALLEAARQATTAHLGHPTLPLTLTTTFTNYAELDTPCHLQTHTTTPTTPSHHTTHITCHQNNHPVFTSTITTTP